MRNQTNKPVDYTRLVVGAPMTLDLGWPTKTAMGSVMHALWIRRRHTSMTRRSKVVVALCVAALLFGVPVLLKSGAFVGTALQRYLAEQPVLPAPAPEIRPIPAETTAIASVAEDAPAAEPTVSFTPAAESPAASASEGAVGVAPPLPVPLPVLTAAPPPLAVGELVAPTVPAPRARSTPSTASRPATEKGSAAEAPGSVVIDVSGGARHKAEKSNDEAPTSSKAGETMTAIAAKAPPARGLAARKVELNESVTTLPAPTRKPVVEQNAIDERQFAQPRTERGANLALPEGESKKPDRPARVGRITIVDIAADGRSVLVTDPETRLPKKFVIGDQLPNGARLQSIDPSGAKITASGVAYEME